MKIDMLPLSQLLAMAHPKNPKDHDIDKLVESFERFDFTAPPTIDEASKVMVAGHGRCEALERMRAAGKAPPGNIELRGAEWYVPVVRGVSFKSDKERDAYVIADNQHVMAGGWKFDVLSELIGGLRDDGGFSGLGFEQVELDALLGNYVQPDAPEGPNPTTPPPEPPEGWVRHDINVQTTYCCPKCKYEWSGEPK